MSLYDQYEQETLKYSTMVARKPAAHAEEDQKPIFRKIRLELQPADVITHMAVSNNHVVLALRTKRLLKYDLNHKSQAKPNEIEMSNYLGDRSQFAKLHKLFLSPTGKYSVLSFYYSDGTVAANCENFYMHKKVRCLTKFRGYLITAVGWNYQNENPNLDSTSNILVGTSKGQVFETELISNDDASKWLSSGPEQYCRVVFVAGDDAGEISNIEFHQTSEDKTFFILVTTKNRLYQFVGTVDSADGFSLANIFNNYQNNNQYQDMPGNLGFSKLDFYYPRNQPPPATFGWLTEPGILYGKLDFEILKHIETKSTSKVTADAVLIPYTGEENKRVMDFTPPTEKPISILLTKFHILVLFKTYTRIICVVNEQVVMEDFFTETYGSALGITKDVAKGTIWAYSELAVFRYKVTNEERDLWKIYLDQGNFKMAKEYAKGDSKKLATIVCEEADYYYNQKEYMKSAALYAQSSKSFEEIALKFLRLGNQDALQEFLTHKLDSFSRQDRTQITLLILWLLEMILNQMAFDEISGNTASEEYGLRRAKLESLLNFPKITEAIYENRKAVYDLISTHGDEDSLVYVATVMRDFNVVIESYLERQKWDEILSILETQQVPTLIYKYAPILMQEKSTKLIEILKKQSLNLIPNLLLPALIQHTTKKQYSEVVGYLEHLVYTEKLEDTTVHNYLLALYAETDPKKLLDYIERRSDGNQVSYDINYALRICSEIGLAKACVNLYTIMELYEEAVDLALTTDLDLAKKTADLPQLDEDLRKKLWLKIAKHVVTQEKNIDQVTELLKECSILRIEDVLPYFPDFITISHFKFAICSSLEEYNKHIEILKEEMRDATESAENIREEVKCLRNRYSVVKTEDKCSLCGYAVLTGPFYVFPCRHVFHSTCLSTEILAHIRPKERSRLEAIEKQLQSANKFPVNSNAQAKTTREQLRNELDEIVASECLFCGEMMIQTIDLPFVLPDESDVFSQGW